MEPDVNSMYRMLTQILRWHQTNGHFGEAIQPLTETEHFQPVDEWPNNIHMPPISPNNIHKHFISLISTESYITESWIGRNTMTSKGITLKTCHCHHKQLLTNHISTSTKERPSISKVIAIIMQN